VKPNSLFNGAPAVALAHHRGLHYGDGVFRTCLIYDSQINDLDEQLKKLLSDAARLELTLANPAALRGEALALAGGEERGVLKMLLIRSGAQRGYRSEDRQADRLLCRYAAPRYPAAFWDEGIVAGRSRFKLASQPALAGIKHLNRLEQVLASRDLYDFDELILPDDQDRPVCGSRTNLFWARTDSLYTPPLDHCGVAGVTRDKVLRAAEACGIRTEVRAGSWADLEAADEAFVTNSVIGIWPLARLDARTWPGPGAVTRRLMEALKHPRLAPP
jgi:4-amino-4-deoxychorismate lyase